MVEILALKSNSLMVETFGKAHASFEVKVCSSHLGHITKTLTLNLSLVTYISDFVLGPIKHILCSCYPNLGSYKKTYI